MSLCQSPATATLALTAPLNPAPLILRLSSWAGPPQDRQLFDTISLLIQGSLEGELKLMDELAGPGGQPSAFPPVRSPCGSDPQVTVSPCCAGLCHVVPCFWGGGGGVFPARWVVGEGTASGPQVELRAWQEAAGGSYQLRSALGTHTWKVGTLRLHF